MIFKQAIDKAIDRANGMLCLSDEGWIRAGSAVTIRRTLKKEFPVLSYQDIDMIVDIVMDL